MTLEEYELLLRLTREGIRLGRHMCTRRAAFLLNHPFGYLNLESFHSLSHRLVEKGQIHAVRSRYLEVVDCRTHKSEAFM